MHTGGSDGDAKGGQFDISAAIEYIDYSGNTYTVNMAFGAIQNTKYLVDVKLDEIDKFSLFKAGWQEKRSEERRVGKEC